MRPMHDEAPSLQATTAALLHAVRLRSSALQQSIERLPVRHGGAKRVCLQCHLAPGPDLFPWAGGSVRIRAACWLLRVCRDMGMRDWNWPTGWPGKLAKINVV